MGLCKKSFRTDRMVGLFTQPIIFFWEVVLRKKLCFFLKTTSQIKFNGVGKNLTAVRQARNEFLHNPIQNIAYV